MNSLQRNQLVWLHEAAWQHVLASPWDAQARAALEHWAQAALPLVVTRQRGEVPQHRICVGLPAPAQWGRRRLALDVSRADIGSTGYFPALAQALPLCAEADPEAVARALACMPALPLQLYGSFGWQAMTGLAYVHAQSDLDVLVTARDLPEALSAAAALRDWADCWQAPWRLDGEVQLPGGHAVAWRELLQAKEGRVAQVLVKHRKFAALMTPDALQLQTGASVVSA